MNTYLPSLFVSHGSPMMALDPGAAGSFLQRLGPAIDATFARPRAVLAISAHTLARVPTLWVAQRHQALHDFGGFPDELFAMRYDAPGAPMLADQVEALLRSAGIEIKQRAQAGMDHGIWIVLRFMYPNADVPVLPLALVPRMPPAQQFALGEALASLRQEGVLVLGSGSITHNLRLALANQPTATGSDDGADKGTEMPESYAFRRWVAEHSATRDWEVLFEVRSRAPHALLMHPTDEHLLPWYAAAGAGGRDATPLRLHEGVTLGCLGMDAYAFGMSAATLQAALTVR